MVSCTCFRKKGASSDIILLEEAHDSQNQDLVMIYSPYYTS